MKFYHKYYPTVTEWGSTQPIGFDTGYIGTILGVM